MSRRRAFCAALLFSTVAAACGHSSGSSSGSTTSTLTPAAAKGVYARPGNFTVGVTTLHLASGRAVEVWYPANGAVNAGSATYDVRAFLPVAAAKRLPAAVHAYVGTDATRNAAVGAPGEQFPLVVLSHGTGGFPDQSTFLTTWLASWGMVVAVPDLPATDLAGTSTPRSPDAAGTVSELRATIDLLLAANARTGTPFKDRILATRIAVVGYDTGAASAIALAADSRVRAYVALAPVTASSPDLPTKPSLFLAGGADRVVAPAAVAALYRAAPSPSYEWAIAGAGHNAFSDTCVVAKGHGGLLGLVDEAGIGAAFSAPLRATLTDGCAAPDLAVTNTWPIIDQVVTAFLRHVIGSDPTAVGVGPAGMRTQSGVTVTVSAK